MKESVNNQLDDWIGGVTRQKRDIYFPETEVCRDLCYIAYGLLFDYLLIICVFSRLLLVATNFSPDGTKLKQNAQARLKSPKMCWLNGP